MRPPSESAQVRLTFPARSRSILELRNLASAFGSDEFKVCWRRERSRLRLIEVNSGFWLDAGAVGSRAMLTCVVS